MENVVCWLFKVIIWLITIYNNIIVSRSLFGLIGPLYYLADLVNFREGLKGCAWLA